MYKDIMRRLVTIIALVISGAAGCAPTEKVWDAYYHESPIVSYSSTFCYGRCPIVDIYAYEDGGIVFRGSRPYRRFPKERPRTKHASPTMTYFENTFFYDHTKTEQNTFYDLLDQLEDAGFFDLQDKYTSSVECGRWLTDSSTHIIEVRTGDRWKKLVYYKGCSDFEDEAVVKNIMDIVMSGLRVQYFIDKHLSYEKENAAEKMDGKEMLARQRRQAK